MNSITLKPDENTEDRHLVCSSWLGSDFRVVWKREGLKQKAKAYKTLKGAQRFAGILGPNPWEHLGIDPDRRICCSGYECGCEGATYRSRHEEARANMPALEWVRIEQRQIGPWLDMPNAKGETRSPKN